MLTGNTASPWREHMSDAEDIYEKAHRLRSTGVRLCEPEDTIDLQSLIEHCKLAFPDAEMSDIWIRRSPDGRGVLIEWHETE
jgi:hypothetical protein